MTVLLASFIIVDILFVRLFLPITRPVKDKKRLKIERKKIRVSKIDIDRQNERNNVRERKREKSQFSRLCGGISALNILLFGAVGRAL